MSFDIEAIYSLLPAIYRTRDAAIAETLDDLLTPAEQARLQSLRDALASGAALDPTQQRDLRQLEEKRLRGPLKALLTVIGEQVAGLEENILQLYDDQFIETCADWAVPYLADLIGYRALDPRLQSRIGSARAEVANTIGFRRRKGTAAVLEEMALNITGWDAAVVEYFLRLATTQYLNHLRLDHPGTVDLRRVDQLEAIGSPFDRLAHTADVRRVAGARGRYNIPNLAIFLWRVASYTLTDSPAYRVDARRFLFSPLGTNTPLFNAAERETDMTRLAGTLNVPQPISRRVLRAKLEQLYGPNKSLTIQVGARVLGVGEVEACDLSDTGSDPETSAWAHAGQALVAVDPVLGRIVLPSATAEPVLVTYHYGAVAPIGGGGYDRRAALDAAPEPVREVPGDRPGIDAALADIAGEGTVEVTGNARFDETPVLQVNANRKLELRADSGSRPLLWLGGDLLVGGADSGEVMLSGLLIAGGSVRVPAQFNGQPNRLQKLRISHCTLVPGATLLRDGRPGPAPISLVVEAPDVTLELESCIVGGLRVADTSSTVISHSIVDALGATGVAYAALDGLSAGGPLNLDSCTVVGKVATALLTASNSILHAALAGADTWAAPILAERRQAGYLRFCYVPLDARTPPRFACFPRSVDQAVRIVPRFTSLRYGRPAYGQLHPACPCEIRRGADDEGEMGAFHDLYAPQREDGLRVRLDEYLRFGMEAGLFFAS